MLSNPWPVSSGGNSDVGVVVDAHQVADRVAVLDPVEPADGDAARVGILRVDPEGRVLDPVLQRPPLLGRRPRLAGRGHEPGPHVLEHRQPELGIVQPLRLRLEAVERHAPLLDPVAVAGIAESSRIGWICSPKCSPAASDADRGSGTEEHDHEDEDDLPREDRKPPSRPSHLATWSGWQAGEREDDSMSLIAVSEVRTRTGRGMTDWGGGRIV